VKAAGRVAALWAVLGAGAFPATAGETAELVLSAAAKDLPAITFSDQNGQALGLDAFRGKVVVLDFWATWCAPCRTEFPSLDRLQGEMGGKDVVVVAVSLDRGGMKAIDRFYDQMHVAHLDKFVDTDGDSARRLGVFGLPTTLVLDRSGREVARVEGEVAWDSPAVAHVLDGLLGKS
jgi:thiol-disulfide isomerase/thioredoxin